jgi:Uma2 family endonuclease
MSLAVLTEIVAGRAPAPVTFTVEEYHRMLAGGILADGQPVELIDGVVMRKDRAAAGEGPMGHGTRHAVAIARIQKVLERHIGQQECHVRTQLPTTLSDTSEPEPDLALVAGQDTHYLDHHPGPAETLLVIEVADSSLEYDRTTKHGLYASAGVREYWVVNFVDEQVEVYQSPIASNRRFAQQAICQLGCSIELRTPSAPIDLRVDDLIPPRP